MKAKRTRSEVGRRCRESGKEYERAIATLLRERYPGADVRRASQAERAHNPDVFVVSGGPTGLRSAWMELTCGHHPDPAAKLLQAERDVLRLGIREAVRRVPVCVWSYRREPIRLARVTMRASSLGRLTRAAFGSFDPPAGWDPLVTIGLDPYLRLVELADA